MKGQELKQRITGVAETVKITKAMQMISASKMNKSQAKYEHSKKYLQEVKKGIRLVMTPSVMNHPYFDAREGELRIAYIVIAGDKGLCGDYNNAVFDKVYKDMQKRNVADVFAIGHMTVDFFKKKRVGMDRSYVHMMQNPMPEDARIIAEDIVQIFTDKKIDKVYLVFTELENLARQSVTIKKILPVHYVEQKDSIAVLSGEKNITNMLKQYVWAEIYYALASSALAYNYKSMVTMQQSTSNGEQIIEELKIEYNHKRQESITTELLDAATSMLGKRL